MNCPHCMDDAKETGNDMTLETFCKAMEFGEYIGAMHFILSGGEPTENKRILDFCNVLDTMAGISDVCFSITSNGMWLKSEEKQKVVSQICRLQSYVGMQVYTNKKWYKEYDYVVSHKEDYKRFPGVIVDDESEINMVDLGRARSDRMAQMESMANPHFMSCLNATLVAAQIRLPSTYGVTLIANRKFCSPSVDALGNVHMSESRLCPSVGNVCKDKFDDIWNRMRTFRPCGKCMQFRTFVHSTRADVIGARKLLGI